MQWTRSNTLALATLKCTTCLGVGMTLGRRGSLTACDCVLRSIFRLCYQRFRHCVEKEKYLSKVTLEIHSGPNRRGTWGRKDEEYIADFLRLARRTLSEQEYRVFNYRFLLGADWRLCVRKLKMDRGTFFHLVYRIQEKLGRVFAETEPYSLYPVAEYFCSSPREEVVSSTPSPDDSRKRVIPIRPPVAKRGPSLDLELLDKAA
jgi:hypothetical protein